MKYVKAKELEPGMILIGYANYEFYRFRVARSRQARTILSVEKIPDSDCYEIKTLGASEVCYEIKTLGASEVVTRVSDDRMYLVKEESDDE